MYSISFLISISVGYRQISVWMSTSSGPSSLPFTSDSSVAADSVAVTLKSPPPAGDGQQCTWSQYNRSQKSTYGGQGPGGRVGGTEGREVALTQKEWQQILTLRWKFPQSDSGDSYHVLKYDITASPIFNSVYTGKHEADNKSQKLIKRGLSLQAQRFSDIPLDAGLI